MERDRQRSFMLLVVAAILCSVAGWLLFDTEPGSLLTPLTADAAPPTRYVATTGMDTGVCTNSAAPCRTIQYAVDQAGTFDQVAVAQGTYTQTNVRPRSDITTTGSVTQVVYITKTLNVIGGFTTTNWVNSFPLTQPTTIDARGLGRGVYVANGAVPTLEDLSITNGNAAHMGGGATTSQDAGGGIYLHASGLNLLRVNVISNTAQYGGGLYLDTLTTCAVCQANTIISNTARFGGGIYLRDSPNFTLTNNVISDNVVALGASGAGGGLYLDNSPVTVLSNTISSNQGGAGGGGLLVHNSAATVRKNTISRNSVLEAGGGIYVEGSNATVSNNAILTNSTATTIFGGAGVFIDSASGGSFNSNVIRWNTSAQDGGGVFVLSNVAFVNNVIEDNSTGITGSGIYAASSSPQFKHTTIARNTGGDGAGLRADLSANVSMTDTIISNVTTGISVSTGSTVNLDASLFFAFTLSEFGGQAGAINTLHEHTGDPFFADDGYHLTPWSTNAIDQGIDAGVTTDIDGQTRPFSFAVDIGADEFVPIKNFLPTILK